MLTKYSMAFFTFSLLFGILISKQRKMLYSKHIIGAAVLAILIWLPNIIWQLQHHLPVIIPTYNLETVSIAFLYHHQATSTRK